MVRMRGNRTLRAERDDHLGTYLADAPRQVAGDRVKVLLRESPIRIGQYFALAHLQKCAGSREFRPAHHGQFGACFGGSAMGGGLPFGQANNVGFHPSGLI